MTTRTALLAYADALEGVVGLARTLLDGQEQPAQDDPGSGDYQVHHLQAELDEERANHARRIALHLDAGQEINRLREQVSEHQRTINELETGSVVKFEREITEAKQKCEELEKVIGSRNAQVDKLQSAAEAKATRIKDLEAQLVRKRDWDSPAEELRAAEEQVAELKAQKAAVTKRAQELELENSNQAHDLDQVRKDLAQAGQVRGELAEQRDTLDDEVVKLENELKQTHVSLEKAERARQELVKKLAAAEKQLADAPAPENNQAEKINVLEQEINHLRGLNNDKTKQLRTVRTQLKNLQSTFTEKTEALDEATTERNEAVEEAKRLRGATADATPSGTTKARAALNKAKRMLTADNDDYGLEKDDQAILLIVEALDHLKTK